MQIIDRFKQYLQGGPEGQGGGGAEENSPRLPCTSAPPPSWTSEALARLERVLSFVRGMVIRAVEGYARRNGWAEVTPETLRRAKGKR